MQFCCLYHLVLLVAVFVCVHGLVPNSDGFINLNCGMSDNETVIWTEGLWYVSDSQYIDTGLKGKNTCNHTLRSFPNNTKNCYTLTPVTKGSKYLVRATFNYGNCDRLSNPPIFDLYFGVNFWCTVYISSPKFVTYYEIIGNAPADYLEVCLVNTGHGTPFISMLELRPLNDWVYPLADSTRSLNYTNRLDIGSDYVYTLRYPNDTNDRLWYSWMISSWERASTNSSIYGGPDFEVPSLVLQTAAVASEGSSIEIEWLAPNKSNTYYVVLHFSEIQNLQNTSLREFYLYSNEKLVFPNPIRLGNYLSPHNFSYITTNKTNYSISLQSSARATLPPILNAFELYTILPVRWIATYDGDVTAIKTIKESYSVFRGCNGDPCVPTSLGWTGVTCTTNYWNITRIKELDLSSKGLTSEMISAFGNLTVLKKLDLSNNNLSGNIPSSLDQLVSLTFLDLSGNSKLLCKLPAGLEKRRNNGLLKVKEAMSAMSTIKSLVGTMSCPIWDNNMFEKKDITMKNSIATSNLKVIINGSFKGTAPIKKSSKVAIIGIAGVVTVWLIIGAVALFFSHWKKHKKTHINPSTYEQHRNLDQTDFNEFGVREKGLNFDKRQFSNEELKLITRNFSDQIGIGGFGKVFKGQLENGMEVAVKVHTETSSQGIKQFLNEVEMLSRIHHKYLVSLIGYCKDSNHIALVYEYLQQGNLHDCLRGNTWPLPWKQRLKIAYESAQGLEYLHKMCNPPLIHRDVKASNILLTADLEAKISDFGLVRAFSGTYVSTQVIGTPGYLDPYYATTSQLTEKSDVYSFGVVLLEIITGKTPILEGEHLTEFVQELLSKGSVESIVDKNIRGQYNINSAWKAADLALKCTNHPTKRPDMTTIVTELNECMNIEMSNIETSSFASGDINQSPGNGYSRNDVGPSDGTVDRGNTEMENMGDMDSDCVPLAR